MQAQNIMWPELRTKAKKKRKARRLPFDQKAAFIIHMMEQNASALTELRSVSGWGFKMSQIADMTRYERSTALLNDLFRMVDMRLIAMEAKGRASCGLSSVEYWFYTHDEHKRAVRQGRLPCL